MKVHLWIIVTFCFSLFSEENFSFKGKHLIASYLECDQETLINPDLMVKAMDSAVKASNATILAKTPHFFEPDGLTILYLLSESHASIHTYPEHSACFVDIFTCGDHCDPVAFHNTLKSLLKPKQADAKLFLRHNSTEEVLIDAL